MKPTLTFLSVLTLAPLAALHAADEPAKSAAKPNILCILADDMGYADPGFMGSKAYRTPELDQLARTGTILTAFYVQPVCSPTRAVLMTGRYPSRTGVYGVVVPNDPWVLKPEERTLGQALREAGYETAIVGKWHLGDSQPAQLPTQRGFDHQYGLMRGEINYFTHKHGDHLDWYRDDQPCKDEGYSTHLLAKEACRRIREKQDDKPLFLYLAFNAVHYPWHVPHSYTKPFTHLKGPPRAYAGMVAAMDEAVGQVVAALKEKGLLENTLIIFSSDNGGPWPGWITSNGPLRGRKGLLYEGGIRVCAFVCWPGRIPAGKTLNAPFHIVDWYPTLIKLAGGSLEQKLPIDGRDIWPVLTQGAQSPHEVILACGMKPENAAVRAGDWKLIHNGGKNELYNLATDLGETNNLAGSRPEMLKELLTKLDTLMGNARGAKDHARP
jgi:arylsulfatase A-like enzyme